MRATIISLAIAALALGACGDSRGAYKRPERNVQQAEKRYQQAVKELDDDPEKAEELLTEALTLDLYHGAAHNNLGVLLLARGELYEAAQEFEWARKLMPGHPDPRVNLAIALDRGGRTSDAIAACDGALEVRPHHLPAMQAKALICLRDAIPCDDIEHYLGVIQQRGESEQWREWAKMQLLRM